MPDAPGEVMKRESVTLAGASERGGSVARGVSYLVGERGPEIFTSGARGQISTYRTLATLAARSFSAEAVAASIDVVSTIGRIVVSSEA